ncbi:MAG: C25 family cysteine peptidase [Thermoplasmatota archaeon]
MKKIIPILIIVILFSHQIYLINVSAEENTKNIYCFIVNSVRHDIEDAVIIPDNDPLFALLGSYISCWYNSGENQGIKPLIIQKDATMTLRQSIFLNQYFSDTQGSILILGQSIQSHYTKTEILGSPTNVSLETATHVYASASTVLIIPKDTTSYKINLIASPLASYLDLPILIYDNNSNKIGEVCNILNTTDALIIGDVSLQLPDINTTFLQTVDDIQKMILTVIQQKFGTLSYLTLANPSDTISPSVISSNTSTIIDHISNIKITALNREFNIKGTSIKNFSIHVPEGIHHLEIFTNISIKKTPLIEPIIFISLFDPTGNLVAYSSSSGYDIGSAYLQTLITNASGTYTITVEIYNGIKGGFFSQRGLSIVNTDFQLSSVLSKLEQPHLPLIPKLSMMASYLTAARGGIIIADENFTLYDESYSDAANGFSSGPWHNEELHEYNNEKVRYVVNQMNSTLQLVNECDMLDDYLQGPGWCAILAGKNMIPMYYYPSQPSNLIEKGLPSDNPYSLNWNLSVGRVVGWNVEDVSLLIAKTLFYEEICTPIPEKDGWHNTFHFIFGEGFGETGGIFHQIPYSKEIQQYGFHSEVFGNLRNGRRYAEQFNIYTDANYIEYLGHGDWFWYTPSLYGFDIYSKAIDVAHVKEWFFEKPSIFLSSACFMGRIDGISPRNNIGLTMLHAGCIAFIGATRVTGRESGLEALENHLIVDDYSIGEALRAEKRIDKEPPTYYVRVLYGDPAFNPYEPNNSFSNRGRPALIS